MAENEVRVRIKAEDQASQEIEKTASKLEKFAKDAEKWGKSVRNFGSEITRLGTTMSLMGGAITGLFGVAIKNATDYVAEITQLAQRTNVAVDTMSELAYAAKLSHLSFSELGTGLSILGRNMILALNQMGNARQIFNTLGVSVTDASGRLKSVPQVLFEVVKALDRLPDSAFKSYASMYLFGRMAGGSQFLWFFKLLAQHFDEIQKEARELGITVTKDVQQPMLELWMQIIRLQNAALGLEIAIAKNLGPTIKWFVDWIIKIVTGVKRWMEANPELANTVAKVIGGIGVGLVVLGTFNVILGTIIKSIGMFSMLLRFLPALISPTTLAIVGVGAAIILLIRYWPQISAFAKNLGRAFGEIGSKVWQSVKEGFSKAVDWMKNLASRMYEAGKQFLLSWWEGVKAQWNQSMEWLKKLAQAIFNFFGGGHSPALVGPLSNLEHWGAELVNAYIEGIVNNLSAISRWLTPKLDTIVRPFRMLTREVFEFTKPLEFGKLSVSPIYTGAVPTILAKSEPLEKQIVVYVRTISSDLKNGINNLINSIAKAAEKVTNQLSRNQLQIPFAPPLSPSPNAPLLQEQPEVTEEFAKQLEESLRQVLTKQQQLTLPEVVTPVILPRRRGLQEQPEVTEAFELIAIEALKKALPQLQLALGEVPEQVSVSIPAKEIEKIRKGIPAEVDVSAIPEVVPIKVTIPDTEAEKLRTEINAIINDAEIPQAIEIPITLSQEELQKLYQDLPAEVKPAQLPEKATITVTLSREEFKKLRDRIPAEVREPRIPEKATITVSISREELQKLHQRVPIQVDASKIPETASVTLTLSREQLQNIYKKVPALVDGSKIPETASVTLTLSREQLQNIYKKLPTQVDASKIPETATVTLTLSKEELQKLKDRIPVQVDRSKIPETVTLQLSLSRDERLKLYKSIDGQIDRSKIPEQTTLELKVPVAELRKAMGPISGTIDDSAISILKEQGITIPLKLSVGETKKLQQSINGSIDDSKVQELIQNGFKLTLHIPTKDRLQLQRGFKIPATVDATAVANLQNATLTVTLSKTELEALARTIDGKVDVSAIPESQTFKVELPPWEALKLQKTIKGDINASAIPDKQTFVVTLSDQEAEKLKKTISAVVDPSKVPEKFNLVLEVSTTELTRSATIDTSEIDNKEFKLKLGIVPSEVGFTEKEGKYEKEKTATVDTSEIDKKEFKLKLGIVPSEVGFTEKEGKYEKEKKATVDTSGIKDVQVRYILDKQSVEQLEKQLNSTVVLNLALDLVGAGFTEEKGKYRKNVNIPIDTSELDKINNAKIVLQGNFTTSIMGGETQPQKFEFKEGNFISTLEAVLKFLYQNKEIALDNFNVNVLIPDNQGVYVQDNKLTKDISGLLSFKFGNIEDIKNLEGFKLNVKIENPNVKATKEGIIEIDKTGYIRYYVDNQQVNIDAFKLKVNLERSPAIKAEKNMITIDKDGHLRYFLNGQQINLDKFGINLRLTEGHLKYENGQWYLDIQTQITPPPVPPPQNQPPQTQPQTIEVWATKWRKVWDDVIAAVKKQADKMEPLRDLWDILVDWAESMKNNIMKLKDPLNSFITWIPVIVLGLLNILQLFKSLPGGGLKIPFAPPQTRFGYNYEEEAARQIALLQATTPTPTPIALFASAGPIAIPQNIKADLQKEITDIISNVIQNPTLAQDIDNIISKLQVKAQQVLLPAGTSLNMVNPPQWTEAYLQPLDQFSKTAQSVRDKYIDIQNLQSEINAKVKEGTISQAQGAAELQKTRNELAQILVSLGVVKDIDKDINELQKKQTQELIKQAILKTLIKTATEQLEKEENKLKEIEERNKKNQEDRKERIDLQVEGMETFVRDNVYLTRQEQMQEQFQKRKVEALNKFVDALRKALDANQDQLSITEELLNAYKDIKNYFPSETEVKNLLNETDRTVKEMQGDWAINFKNALRSVFSDLVQGDWKNAVITFVNFFRQQLLEKLLDLLMQTPFAKQLSGWVDQLAGFISGLSGGEGLAIVGVLFLAFQLLAKEIEIIIELFNKLTAWIGKVFEPVQKAIDDFFQVWNNMILSAFKPLGEMLARLVRTLLAPLLTLLHAFLQIIKPSIDNGVAWINRFATALAWVNKNVIKPFAEGIVHTVGYFELAIAKFLQWLGSITQQWGYQLEQIAWQNINWQMAFEDIEDFIEGTTSGGGVQISEITGPTRDLLVELLSPLKNLDILPGLFDTMRDAILQMRDAFLQSNVGGTRVENVNIYVDKLDASYTVDKMIDDIINRLGARVSLMKTARGVM